MKFFKISALLLIVLSSCAFEENVKFEQIKNVKLAGVKDGMVNLTADADFFNPNDDEVYTDNNGDFYIKSSIITAICDDT